MGNSFKTLLIWLGLGLILIMSFNALEQKKDEHRTQVEYSEFIKSAKGGKIESVELESESVMQGYVIKGTYKDADKGAFLTNAPIDAKMVETLIDSNVKVNVKPEKRPSILTSLLYSTLPILLLIAVWVYFMRQQRGG
ncbi:MAG: ATP-dependent metallopeptidase FtsH/Yme1/Tma family protein, partial [Neisseriaceae bacterium]|nr:ATP-dependent metallopeptidase FtsH/Yme1/Tma family protein [Neisseriaceae bacterium]